MSPGISISPFLTMTKLRTWRLAIGIHSTTSPRSVLSFCTPCPLRLPPPPPSSLVHSRNATYSAASGKGHGSRLPASRGSLVCHCHHWFRPCNSSILHPKQQQQLLWTYASHKGTEFAFIIQFNEFPVANSWERDVQLQPKAAYHLQGATAKRYLFFFF